MAVITNRAQGVIAVVQRSPVPEVAVVYEDGQAALAGVATLVPAGVRNRNAAALLAGVATATTVARRQRNAVVPLAGAATLTPVARRTRDGVTAMSGAATLAAAGTVITVTYEDGQAALSGQGTLTATPGRIKTAAAVLAGTATLTATPRRLRQSTAALVGAATLVPVAGRRRNAASAFAGTAALATVARRTRGTGIALTGAATLTPAARRLRQSTSAVAGQGTLAAAGTVIKPPFTALSDDFTTLDTTTKWTASGGVVLDTGRVKLPVLTGYPATLQTKRRYDLTASSIYGQVTMPAVGAGSRGVSLTLRLDASNRLMFISSGGSLLAREVVAGTPTTEVLGVSDTWWRIRESEGNVLWDTSPDGNTWTNRWSQPVAFAIGALDLMVNAGYYGTETATDAYLDNVNVTPAIIEQGAAALSGAAALVSTPGRTRNAAAASPAPPHWSRPSAAAWARQHWPGRPAWPPPQTDPQRRRRPPQAPGALTASPVVHRNAAAVLTGTASLYGSAVGTARAALAGRQQPHRQRRPGPSRHRPTGRSRHPGHHTSAQPQRSHRPGRPGHPDRPAPAPP